MKLNDYLYEEKLKSEWIKEAADLIQKDCKPWLLESRGIPAWRASRKNITDHIRKTSIRSDRRPLTTSDKIHPIIDQIFLKEYGWRARSNVLFVQGNSDTTYFYGTNIYAVYPIGKFKYLWSKKYMDLGPRINYLEYKLEKDGVGKDNPDFLSIIKTDLKLLIKGEHTNKDLHRALTRFPYNEIMINCKEYYMIPEVWHVFIYKEMYGEEQMKKVHGN